METYAEFRPTGFDPRGLALDDQQNWLVVPVSQTRDSGPLDRSNFAAALAGLGDEGPTVEVHRFGHWACGWFEIIIIDPLDTTALKIAEDIERALMDYPVLDDEDYSNTQHAEYLESWDNYAARDFAKELQRWNGLSDRAYDVIDDHRADLLELYEAGLPSGEYYIEESSGLYLFAEDSAKAVSRRAVGRFIQEHR